MKNSNNDDKFLSEDPFEQIDEYIANVNKILSDNTEGQSADNAEDNSKIQPENNANNAVVSDNTEVLDSEISEDKEESDALLNAETSENTVILDDPVKIEKKKNNKKAEKKGNKLEKKAVKKDDEASKGLKTLGIISIFLVILGAGLIGIAVYKLAVKPDYEKEDVSGEISYPYLPSDTDVYPDIVPLATATDATATDATATDATASDANAADLTDTAADESATEAQD